MRKYKEYKMHKITSDITDLFLSRINLYWVGLSAYINNFHSGKNEIEFRGNNLYISGGFIKIIYNNSTLEEIQDTKYFFDGIEGLINVYDSIYIPGNLNSLEVYLHYNSEYETFLTIGNKTVYESDQSGETTVFIDNSNLSSQIDYNSISNKTIPLRLGLKEIQEQPDLQEPVHAKGHDGQ